MTTEQILIHALTAPLSEITQHREAQRDLAGHIPGLGAADNEFLLQWGLPQAARFHPLGADRLVTDQFDYYTHFANLGSPDRIYAEVVAGSDGRILVRKKSNLPQYSFANSSMTQFATTMWRWVLVSDELIAMDDKNEDYFPWLRLFWHCCVTIDNHVDLDQMISFWRARVDNL